MSNKIAFLSSSIEYTKSLLKLAKELERRNFDIYWISHRQFEAKFLLDNEVKPYKILNTTVDSGSSILSEPDILARLIEIESERVPFINDIILMDRLLRQKEDGFARIYLANIQHKLTNFLIDNEISLVSSGRDTALQIVCAKICDKLHIPCVVPTTIRIPATRFGFCLGYTDELFVSLRDVSSKEREWARSFIKTYREKQIVPNYSVVQRQQTKFLRRIPTDLRYFFAKIVESFFEKENDYTRYSIAQLWYKFWFRRLNAMRIMIAKPFEPIRERPYLLYGMQMQPESSIDVMASFYTDQEALITQIARSTPSTHDLYIKPHPDDIGGRSLAEFQRLKQIPGVKLISPHESSHQLIKKADIVLTVTGTMAFESAFYSVPSVVFATKFFTKLASVYVCDTPSELPRIIPQLIKRKQYENSDLEELLAYLYANSIEGRFSEYLGPFTKEDMVKLAAFYEKTYFALSNKKASIYE